MKRDYSKIPEADLIVRYVNLRKKQKGLGTNIFIIGLSGTGKSSTSQRLAELIKKSREEMPETFIVDNLIKLLDAIRKSKIGDIIVVEEVSVLFPSRRAMSGENVGIAKIFDTIRKKELCIISNAPLWNSIDNHMKSMAHILIETLRVMKTEGIVLSKFHRIQTNPASGKIYKHTMMRKGRDVSLMFTRMPNLDRWNEYEKEKDLFMDKLYERLKHTAQQKEDKLDKEMGKKQQPKIRDLTKRELQVHQLYNIKGLTMEEVSKKLNISTRRAYQINTNMQKKSQFAKENSGMKVQNDNTSPLN